MRAIQGIFGVLMARGGMARGLNGADDQEASGTLRVSKLGYWEERDADDTKRGSERIRIWVPYQP